MKAIYPVLDFFRSFIWMEERNQTLVRGAHLVQTRSNQLDLVIFGL